MKLKVITALSIAICGMLIVGLGNVLGFLGFIPLTVLKFSK